MTSVSIEQVSPETLRKVIVAAAIGNFVEWFDFAVYGFLATTIAQQFFPSGDASAALLKTFAVFAVAFAFRPLAGFFRHAGGQDRPQAYPCHDHFADGRGHYLDRYIAHLCCNRGYGADPAHPDSLRPGLFCRR